MSNLQDLGVGAKITVFRLPDGYISATRTVRRVHKHVLVCSMGDKWNRASGTYEGEYYWSNRNMRVRPALPGDVDVVRGQTKLLVEDGDLVLRVAGADGGVVDQARHAAHGLNSGLYALLNTCWI